MKNLYIIIDCVKKIIRSNKVASIVLAIVLLFFTLLNILGQDSDKAEIAVPQVLVSKAAFGPVERYINAIGTLRPYESVVIKSEVNSKIEKIYFSEGSIVQEGALLIEFDDKVAKASLAEAEAQHRRAKSEFEPVEKLADKGVMARVQSDTKKAEMDTCAAKVSLCKANLEKHKIIAPFRGIVGLKEISVGQFMSPGGDLLKLVDCHPLKVDFKVAEVDICNISVNQEIDVFVGGDDTKKYTAKIIAIDPESDKISHSFDVRAILDVPESIAETSNEVKPGRFVSVKIVLGSQQNGIVIPESALEKIGEEDMVYRVVDGIAIRTLVTAGVRKDGNVEIITGVNEGDDVITDGQIGVLDGKPVKIQNSHSVSEIKKVVSDIYKKKQQINAKNKKGVKNGNH